MFPAYYHNEKARHFDESSLVLQTTPEFSTQNSGILLIAAFLTNRNNSKISKTFKKAETQCTITWVAVLRIRIRDPEEVFSRSRISDSKPIFLRA
jgi:hypothetical protein